MLQTPARRASVRPTSAEIDRGILDAAARTFAGHGFARTSVQQLADAVGYSKTGLLHRFASKQVLHDACVAQTGAAVQDILDAAAEVPAGRARVRTVLERVAATALDLPGSVQLLMESIRPASAEPGRESLHALAGQVVDALGGGTPEQRLRTVLAVKLIVNAVLVQGEDALRVDRALLQPLIVALALAVLDT